MFSIKICTVLMCLTILCSVIILEIFCTCIPARFFNFKCLVFYHDRDTRKILKEFIKELIKLGSSHRISYCYRKIQKCEKIKKKNCRNLLDNVKVNRIDISKIVHKRRLLFSGFLNFSLSTCPYDYIKYLKDRLKFLTPPPPLKASAPGAPLSGLVVLRCFTKKHKLSYF